MAVITSPSKVLVTGANGYIASWLVSSLLEKGYSARGTLRSLSKAAFFQEKHKEATASGRLEFCVVDDLTAPGAFDDAVKGVDAIYHVASPVHLNADDPEGKSSIY